MSELTVEEKLEKYRKGLYRMEVPPVASFNWQGPRPWVIWIDATGEWLEEPTTPKEDSNAH